MQIYNTQTHRKQELEPIEPGKIRMYVCGPTVYDQIHIGNARTFLSFDVIRRYLMYKGYEVTFAQNLTDVDDKIINRPTSRVAPPPTCRRSSPMPSSSRCTALGSSTPTSARAPRTRLRPCRR